MISLSVTVSGETVGIELANDLEEASGALIAMASHMRDDGFGDLIETLRADLMGRDGDKVAIRALCLALLTACEPSANG